MIGNDPEIHRRILESRDAVLAVVDKIEDSEALSIMTLIIADRMMSIATSENQYMGMVDTLNEFLSSVPDILEALETINGAHSVKH